MSATSGVLMTHLNDLSPCNCLPAIADHILAVGWLEKASTFPIGPTSQAVFERLLEFAQRPWQPYVSAGVHACSLCQFAGECSGTSNLFIPYRGNIYVCPELITHYINAHHYQPPSVFCEAVLACPAMDSLDYKRRLIACNGAILWQSELPDIPTEPRLT